jgi:hypothetical protein
MGAKKSPKKKRSKKPVRKAAKKKAKKAKKETAKQRALYRGKGKKEKKKSPAQRPARPVGTTALSGRRGRAARGELAPPGVTTEAAEALFPPEEIERLRLVVLTSARREEKIEALRRLAYSPLDLDAKAEIFLGRLADPDAELRVEAAQLLRMLGLDPEVADSVRELERGDEPQKLFAIDRLGRRMLRGGALDVAASLIAFIWRLREEDSGAVRRQLIERLEEAAPVISRAPERAEELVRLLVTLFATDPMGVAGPGRRLVRRLGEELPFLREALWSEYEGTGNRHVRVFVLQLLTGFPGSGEDGRLPAAMAEEIARADEREVGFRLLGDALGELVDVGVKALVEVFPKARLPQQKYIVRLLGDICRFKEVSKETKEEVAALFLGLLSGHPREVQLSVLRTQIPADRDLSDKTRSSLAEAFVTNAHMYGFPADIENCEHTISRAGLAAVGPLVERLGPHSAPAERTRAARILGDLAREEGEIGAAQRAAGGAADRYTGGELREALLGLLRTLQRWSLEPKFPDRTALFTAMGKVASTPVIPADVVELVARNLIERRQKEDLGHHVLEALGYIAASPHVSPERATGIKGLFQEQLAAELPELSTEEGEEDGIAVFRIGDEATFYTEAVPAAVRGLAHLALGRKTSPVRTAEVVDFLLDRWEKVARSELDWGPPGAGALIDALKRIASTPRVDVRHKVKIVRALARRVSHLSAMEALGEVFASEDKSLDLGRLAAAVGVGLLRRRRLSGGQRGEFPEDERETALRVLGRIASRTVLDVTTEFTKRLREDVVEELFAGLRDGVDGAYEALARMRVKEKLPERLREEISKRLSAYESLVLA